MRNHAHAPRRQRFSAALKQRLVVRALVHELPLHRTHVFRPLLLDMNQRPLPAAEREMLQL